MKIAFCSNFLSAHQRPLCDALYGSDDCEFRFIATKPLSDTRRAMGWKEEQTPYVIASYESDAAYQSAADYVNHADVVMIAGDEETAFFRIAIKNKNTLIFRCCERIYRQGRWRAISPKGILLRWNSYYKHPKRNLYMLCCSAYAAGDYALLGSYLGHTYKWGYFTKVEDLDISQALDEKEPNLIFWAGRMLDCKHPESAVLVAEHLKECGIPFRMELAGDGPERERIQNMIAEKALTEQVCLLGTQSQEETHARMQKASIYLATSDYREGWGAVVSEAMSHGCAVVGCEAMGAVPFLIRNGQNGFSYPKGKETQLCHAVAQLLMDNTLREQIGRGAYETLTNLWHPTVAANRLIQLAKVMRSGTKQFYLDGPCSKAHVLRKGR